MENEIVLTALGAALTLSIFSYLLGDNPLYRLALHVFVGVSVAYICVVALQSVILPVLSPPDTLESEVDLQWVISLIGIVLGALLFTQSVRGLSWLSNISIAILLGVGVAVALSGAVIGSLVVQADAATNPFIPETPVAAEILEPVGQIVAVIGTITGLMYFSFTSQRMPRRVIGRIINGGARVGHWFIFIGFGAAYGGVLVAGLAIFADRVQYLIEVLEKISGS